MTGLLLALFSIVLLLVLSLGASRWSDRTYERAAWSGLASAQPATPVIFDTSLIDGLPEPARRYFQYAIRPGTPLFTVAEISMRGEMGLGNRIDPGYQPMQARQILAVPHGFVWSVKVGKLLRMSGSDGARNGSSWSRFWLWGIVPVARAGRNADHLRSSFGRYVAEAVFWTPAALLPGEQVRWQAIDDATARVTFSHAGLEQAVDLSVDPEGRLTKVVFQRWSDANPDKAFRLQPFGGYLSDYKDFDGFRLPTRIEAGNFFGTDDYFAFFKVTVTAVRFPRGLRSGSDHGTQNGPCSQLLPPVH